MPKPTLEQRVSQHDREIAAIRKLVLQGMKMLVGMQTEFRREISALTAAQQTTEKKLQMLIDALGRGAGGNGKGRGRIQ